MKIRIKRSPAGEAPDEIRAAWIGLSLPLAYPNRSKWKGFGVITGPKLWITRMIRVFLGRADEVDGYCVDAHEAIHRLSSHNPEAARWWKKNVPTVVRKGQYLIFDADACEVIDDEEE